MNDETPPRRTPTKVIVYLLPWAFALFLQVAYLAPRTQHWTELVSLGGLFTFPIGLPAFFALISGAGKEFLLTIVSPGYRILYTALPWLLYVGNAIWIFREHRFAWRANLYLVLFVFLLLNVAGCPGLFKLCDKIK